MFDLVQLLGVTCIFFGILSSLIASIGLFCFPDVYTRMHATGVTDTLGTSLILVGLMLFTGWNIVIGKLLLILLFTLLTSPTISYVLANTAIKNLPITKSIDQKVVINDQGEKSSNR